MDKIAQKISEELGIKYIQVENTIKLIDDGNTIPFIARYRKEVTGGLSDEILRDLGERLSYLRNLETRKNEIIKLIDEQGKMNAIFEVVKYWSSDSKTFRIGSFIYEKHLSILFSSSL